MSTNNLPVLPASKGTYTSINIPVQSSGVSSLLAAEKQRRGGLPSSTNSTNSFKNTMSNPRHNQSQRKQNKSSRRPKLTDDMVEANGIRTSSRKGQTNITHLMTFQLPPRPQNYSSHSYAGRSSHTHRRQNYSWGYNAVDKARYIHANYRFIVKPNGNYDHLETVDDHVDWNDVLQVLVSTQSQSTNCPICLGDPVSPRMAKCGHIFCLPCLIRYMHSTDDNNPIPEKKARWKKCPICEDSMYISETRPVAWFVGQEGEPPREDGDVVLRLMRRDAYSTLALPREGVDATTLREEIPWYFAAEVMDYARIIKGGESYMQDAYDQEIISLEMQEKEDELMFNEDTQWTQKAIASIREAKERAKGIGNHPSAPPPRSSGKRPVANPINFNSEETRPSRSISMSSVETQPTITTDTSVSSNPQAITTTKRLPHHSRDNEELSTATFYFYQALLHYYLAPLDIRILRAAFGDYSNFPGSVLARVEHVSTGHIVDDDLRKRAKYLGHLPHGCEVGFLECDWTDIVQPEILQSFAPELDRRRKRNKDKEMREEKERLRAEKAEDDKRLASVRRRRSSVTHEGIPGSSIGIPGSMRSDLSDFGTSGSPPLWNQSRTGFGSLASPSTSPNGPKTVWGTSMVAAIESPTLTAAKIYGEPENDGWLQGWEKDLIQDEELVEQTKALSLGTGSVTPSQGGKKKKQKKITLMSTNARRAA